MKPRVLPLFLCFIFTFFSINILHSYAIQNPAVRVYTEESTNQQDIKIFIFGNSESENKIAIIGSMHGDEPQGQYIINSLIEYLYKNLQLVDNKQILLIPAANPDGLSKKTRGNANRVDLNRNFPTKNWQAKKIRDQYFPGDYPGSEVETNILLKYIQDFAPDVIINIHSPLRVIDFAGKKGIEAANMIAKFNNYPTTSNIGYPTPGSFGTYFAEERNITTITLETSQSSNEVAWNENKDGILEVIYNLEQIK